MKKTEFQILIYGPNIGVKDNHTVMVILNNAITDQRVKMDRFTDIIGRYSIGKDVMTSKIIPIKSDLTIPANGEYVLELSN